MSFYDTYDLTMTVPLKHNMKNNISKVDNQENMNKKDENEPLKPKDENKESNNTIEEKFDSNVRDPIHEFFSRVFINDS